MIDCFCLFCFYMFELLLLIQICLFCFYMFELLLLIQKMTCFLSSKRKSQIVATIGTLLDDIHV